MQTDPISAQIQDYLRLAASRGRLVETVGPFLVTVTASDANPYLNYAIPAVEARPTADDIDALVRVFRAHGRKPRLEFMAELAPSVEPALLASGFAVETRTPLMACRAEELVHLMPPEGIELRQPDTDEHIRGMIEAQHEAFGVGAAGDEDVARVRQSIADGAIAVVALDIATGEAAGGGVCTAPSDGFTEVAGIGVRERFRRRGIGAAITCQLTADAFRAGATTPFLMAASQREALIYAKAGYRQIGSVLHISRE